MKKTIKLKITGIKGEPGKDGYTPIKNVDYFDGKNGENYVLTENDKKEIASTIEPVIVDRVIEKTIEKVEVIKEQPIVTEVIKEVSIAETPQQIADKLNTLDKKVDWKVIKNVPYDVINGSGKKTIHRGGMDKFTSLLDTPNSYTSQSLKAVRVKTDETGLEFYTPSASGVQSVVAGTNMSVDNTDPLNPIVNSLSDRYKTTSTTSQTIVSTGTLTFTVDANLAYTSQQDVMVVYDASNHMHGTVNSYSGTTLVIDIQHKTGSGTYASWTINLDGLPVTPTDTLQTVTDRGATTTNPIGFGTTTVEATRTHLKNGSYNYLPLTGTIVSATASVYDINIVGSGTLFLTELKEGDIIVHPTLSYAKAVITRVTSNTACSAISSNFLLGTYNSTGWRKLLPLNLMEDSSGRRIFSSTTNITSPQTGTEITPAHLIKGDVLFQNVHAPNFGLYVRTSAADGRIQMGHINSTSLITFQQGNANLQLERVSITGDSTWASPALTSTSNASNDVRLLFSRSDTGANQTVFAYTQRYAVNNDAPKFQLSANGIDIGRRDGSTWNEGIDDITLSMDKTTGKWQVGSFGTSTPTGATAWFQVVATTLQQRLAYNALNYFDTTVGSAGGVNFEAVGEGAGFTFSHDISVPDEAYGSGWNGSLEVPTKNALYDKIETLSSGGLTQSQVLTRSLGA